MTHRTSKMYNKHKRVLALVQLLLFVFVPLSFAQQQTNVSQTITLIVDDFPPYIDKQSNSGLVTEVIRDVFAQQGIAINLEFAPWSEVEKDVDEGNKLSFMWSKTAQRRLKWSYSEPIYTNRQVLVAKKGSGVFWRRLDQLRQYKLGVTKHYNYGRDFENYRKYLALVESVSDYLSLKKLVKGKVDAVVLEELKAHHLISFFPDTTQSSLDVLSHESIDNSESYLICAKRYAKCSYLLQTFNEGLKQLKQDGRYQEMTTKGL